MSIATEQNMRAEKEEIISSFKSEAGRDDIEHLFEEGCTHLTNYTQYLMSRATSLGDSGQQLLLPV